MRVKDGVLKHGHADPHDGDRRRRTRSSRSACSRPSRVDVDELGPGEIGFITAGIKTVADCRVGDTITDDRKPAAEPLPGFKPSVPVVFCGLFPADAADFEKLRDSLAKLRLNDASFHYEPETSAALGFGFRCGFLGLLHLEIIQERLTREFDLDLITTAPSVVYRVHHDQRHDDGAAQPGRHARPGADRPHRGAVDQGDRSWCPTTISAPILKLCEERRGAAGRADLCRQPRHGWSTACR